CTARQFLQAQDCALGLFDHPRRARTIAEFGPSPCRRNWDMYGRAAHIVRGRCDLGALCVSVAAIAATMRSDPMRIAYPWHRSTRGDAPYSTWQKRRHRVITQQPTKLTRKKLYEKVWFKPIRTLPGRCLAHWHGACSSNHTLRQERLFVVDMQSRR